MKKTAKLVLPAFIIFSFAGLILLVVFYYRTTSTQEAAFTEDKDIGIRVEGLNYANTRDGRTLWRLKAKKATRFKSRELMVLEKVDLLFYAKDGDKFNMKAREGNFNEAKKVINAWGDVAVSSKKGFNLKTERLRYDTAAGSITSDKPVIILRGELRVEGVGFSVDVESGSLEILSNVRAVVSVKGINEKAQAH